MPPKKTFTFSLPDELKDGLRMVRERDGTPDAEQIRRGIQLWLDSKGVKVKAAPRRAPTRRKA